jgi:hypothetical protein
MSARTDGGVMNPDAPAYGDNLELQNLTTQAPLAGAAGAPAPGGGGGVDLSQVVGLGAPSQDQLPVTAGAAAGPGPGPEVLGLPMDPTQERRADARALSPALLNALAAEASRADATPSFKRRVREVLSSL